MNMYFEEEIANEKAILQDEIDEGFITESEYNLRLAEIEAKEEQYYNAEW